ncbi:mitotic-spindle organizing gamma-tubulin ring associated domain-containing protein [Phthorimaea operculella]|nr:mitotic-spindle organizing gamma-tubulin ring associated domain-containing protein [Phthorimaea operculella]
MNIVIDNSIRTREELYEKLSLWPQYQHIYTDGSKTDTGVSLAYYHSALKTGNGYKLPKPAIFQSAAVSTKTMTSEKNAQLGQAREAFQMLYQISQLLGTGLDAETLTTCIKLCELGVDPEVLAHVIKEIRKVGDSNTQNAIDKFKL